MKSMEAEIGSLHEELAGLYVKLSGKRYHASDCATSCSPAERPGPCDCDAPYTDLGLMVKQLRKAGTYTEASMVSLCNEAAAAITALNSNNN